MAYQTLYRKYRPKSFEYVYGQDTIVKTLKNIIMKDKLSHAYLFSGPRGTGKTSCAKLFAKTVNCLNNVNGEPCNECAVCKAFNENMNPDIIEIDAASNNGVDEIREIKNKITLVPSISKYKVYIIDEVHMLSIGAFNALLKTLEEPPEYIIFILATTEPQKIPATIISRCQKFDFKPIAPIKMKDCLKNIINKENIIIEEEAIDEIITNSLGGMRDAIGMLDQSFAFCEENITKKDIEELSGNVSDDSIIEFLTNVGNINYAEIINKINEWNNNGKDFLLITQKIINHIKRGIIYKKINNINDLSDLEKEFYNKYSDSMLYLYFDDFSNLYEKLQKSNQKQVIFEIQLIYLLDKINNYDKKSIRIKNNVPRETLDEVQINVPREILKEEQNDVPRETLEDKNKNVVNELEEKIEELKEIRINNILKESSKENLNIIKEKWNNLNEFLIDDEFKMSAGLLITGTPVAASSKGILITFSNSSNLSRIENKYDQNRQLLNKLYDNNYKIVCVTDDYWKKVRPYYVEKVRNNQLEIKDEEYLISQINKIRKENSIEDFNELIEVEK